MPAEKVSMMKPSDARKSNKPIMEKRRRARINNCLNELKSLILEALKKDPARHSKLEKADILEMTVKHLQNLQRQQMALAVAADASVLNKYRAGFGECVGEVSRYVTRLDGVDPSLRQRLLSHLSQYLKNLHGLGEPPVTLTNLTASHLQMPSSNDVHLGTFGSPEASNLFRGLQLIPTRLPTGEIMFLLPSQSLASTNLGFSGPSKLNTSGSSQPANSGLLAMSGTFGNDSSPVSSTVTTSKDSFRGSVLSSENRNLLSPDLGLYKSLVDEDPASPTATVAQDLSKKLRVDTSEELDLSIRPASSSSSVETEHSTSPTNFSKSTDFEASEAARDPWRPW